MKNLLWSFFFSLALSTTTHANHGPQTWVASNKSVVSILPTWPGYSRPGFGAPSRTSPEGTGVFVDLPNTKASGFLILTAAHVVKNATRIEVRLTDGRRVDAEVVSLDHDADLALLRVPTKGVPLRLLDITPGPGTHVCVLGNPFGLGVSMSCGVVSGPLRTALGFNEIEAFIQTDAASNPGSSGGPLVDANGNLLGLISAIYTKDADIDAGVNFAISSTLITKRMERLKLNFQP
ncbi:trypsin-like peptidase domain-containing protein [Litorivicinus sp.]|nr:trypsin-like peptidase domain-containing protein [Litorivicinus sp.]